MAIRGYLINHNGYYELLSMGLLLAIMVNLLWLIMG